MAISKKVESYLKKKGISAEVIPHKKVFTVYDLGQTLKEKFESIAKTLLVKMDKEYVIVVMPANYKLDFAKFKKALKVKKVSLASEKDMKNKFKTKPGAMLPFGALHNVAVIVDTSLLKTKQALFHAGSFSESLRLKVKEYIKAVEPTVVAVATRVPLKLQVVARKKKKKPTTKKRSSKKRTVKKRKK